MRGREAPGQVRRGITLRTQSVDSGVLAPAAPGCASVASNSACGPYSSARRWKCSASKWKASTGSSCASGISASASVIAAVAFCSAASTPAGGAS